MAQIIDFEKLTIKNMIDKHLGFNQMEFEILITVVKYLYAYMDIDLNDPIDEIHPNAYTSDLFEGDSTQFLQALFSLFKYWDLLEEVKEDFPINNEFEVFSTVEELCLFIEEKIIEKERKIKN